jgi:hypothetical protein
VSAPRERASKTVIGSNYEAELLRCPANRMKNIYEIGPAI